MTDYEKCELTLKKIKKKRYQCKNKIKNDNVVVKKLNGRNNLLNNNCSENQQLYRKQNLL